MDSRYRASRLGLTEMTAKSEASFLIDIPTVFGKVTADSTSPQFPLPSVKDAKRWDGEDGVNGVSLTIQNALSAKHSTLTDAIDNAFLGHLATQRLAHGLLTDSFGFYNRMAEFMGAFNRELSTRDGVLPSEAWMLVATIIRQIFRDLQKVRAIAQEAGSYTDPHRKAGTFLGATLQAHRVMQEYLSASFRSHPSVAPVLNMHLFAHRATLSSFRKSLERLGKVEGSMKEIIPLKSAIASLKEQVKRTGTGHCGGRSPAVQPQQLMVLRLMMALLEGYEPLEWRFLLGWL
jgi:hypothetical protein